jgi:hypothetical protein
MSNLLVVKTVCEENNITTHFFKAEAQRLGIELLKVKSSLTEKQLAYVATKEQVRKILHNIRKLDRVKNEEGLVVVKKFCKKNSVTPRIFNAEAVRLGIKLVKTKSELTEWQHALVATEEQAQAILKNIQKSYELKSNELTVAALARKYKTSIASLVALLKRHNITGRKVRSWSKSGNAHKRNQNTIAFKISQVEKVINS